MWQQSVKQSSIVHFFFSAVLKASNLNVCNISVTGFHTMSCIGFQQKKKRKTDGKDSEARPNFADQVTPPRTIQVSSPPNIKRRYMQCVRQVVVIQPSRITEDHLASAQRLSAKGALNL